MDAPNSGGLGGVSSRPARCAARSARENNFYLRCKWWKMKLNELFLVEIVVI
jgi:hypothetical protein